MPYPIIENDDEVKKAVKAFAFYSNDIEKKLKNKQRFSISELKKEILLIILNGETTKILSQLIPIEIRRKAGIFFTSSGIADIVSKEFAGLLKKGSRILDPACGAGNLLLSCAKYLPIGNNYNETISIWSKKIQGYDLYSEFTHATKLRLTLFALSMHPNEIFNYSTFNFANVFKGIKMGNVFEQKSPFNHCECIVVNPPFGYSHAPLDCLWASGKIQTSALFMDKLLKQLKSNQRIVAILPDVLRSGTRYGKWRKIISSQCTNISVKQLGRFDKNTDVDVFMFNARIGNQKKKKIMWANSRIINNRDNSCTLSDYFHVRVGAVVPHRNPKKGPSYPYIHARTAPAWKTIEHIEEVREFKGTVFSPPFIVVHRTSSPYDKRRCIATIINNKSKVAVENHLLVLIPRNKSISSCKKLIKVLRSPETHAWLNNRIRCRHLTVAALKELPIYFKNETKFN